MNVRTIVPTQRRAEIERLLESACEAYCACAARRRAKDSEFNRERELDALDHLEYLLGELRRQLERDLPHPREVDAGRSRS